METLCWRALIVGSFAGGGGLVYKDKGAHGSYYYYSKVMVQVAKGSKLRNDEALGA